MAGGDCDADVYVDCISRKPVAAFLKKKIETRIGGASKTISFKDNKLFDFIKEVCSVLELYGPCDMDFFIKMVIIIFQKLILGSVVLIYMLLEQELISCL